MKSSCKVISLRKSSCFRARRESSPIGDGYCRRFSDCKVAIMITMAIMVVMMVITMIIACTFYGILWILDQIWKEGQWFDLKIWTKDDVIVAVNSHLSNQKLCIFCIISRSLPSSHYDFLPTWLYRWGYIQGNHPNFYFMKKFHKKVTCRGMKTSWPPHPFVELFHK